MKAVVLDGHSLNPGDLSWESLHELCDLEVYDRIPKEDVINRIGDAEIVITNKFKITKEILEACPNIKYIGILATGYNVVDLEAARVRNIPVTNVPKYSTSSVAQHVFAHILEICNQVGRHSEAVKNGEWSKREDFCFWNESLMELEGKTLGIIGFGSIGKAVANIAKSFGMNIIVHTRTIKKEHEDEQLKFVSLNECFSKSDIITIHAPLTSETKEIINKESIRKMKDGVIIINTSRGPLINEDDLDQALQSGKVYWAGLDVVSKEPIERNNKLLDRDNIFITPHIAWAPKETRQRLMDIAVKNVWGFLTNNWMNVVNEVD